MGGSYPFLKQDRFKALFDSAILHVDTSCFYMYQVKGKLPRALVNGCPSVRLGRTASVLPIDKRRARRGLPTRDGEGRGSDNAAPRLLPFYPPSKGFCSSGVLFCSGSERGFRWRGAHQRGTVEASENPTKPNGGRTPAEPRRPCASGRTV